MASNNIKESIREAAKEVINKVCESELQDTKKYDDCQYCHKPYHSLGITKDSIGEAVAYLNVLKKKNIIKFCPVCGRDLSVMSYEDALKEVRDKTIEQLNTQSDEAHWR
ncbi:hypothetical protein AAHB41_05595 [Pediococcus pentosaceus]|uniref:hypothetical protein n=1 Tax=Pediococcus pentosaceus TaxID=1255 RepID=UPI002FF2C10F